MYCTVLFILENSYSFNTVLSLAKYLPELICISNALVTFRNLRNLSKESSV